MQDTLYLDGNRGPTPFSFDKNVSEVFENMLERSIPGYHIQQSFIAKAVLNHLSEMGTLVDFGASTGSSFIKITELAEKRERKLNRNTATLCDFSPTMVEKCRRRIQKYQKHWEAAQAQILDIRDIEALSAMLASQRSSVEVIILHYVLQFVDPALRSSILMAMWEHLAKGGLLLLGEKVHNSEEKIQKLWEEMHREFKLSRGYDPGEIQKKKQALKNVLLPMHEKELEALITAVAGTRTGLYYSFCEFNCYILIK